MQLTVADTAKKIRRDFLLFLPITVAKIVNILDLSWYHHHVYDLVSLHGFSDPEQNQRQKQSPELFYRKRCS